MKSFYLYKVSNNVNTKMYIGVTGNPKRRWADHQKPSSNCIKLKRAIQKYGKENFKFEVICEGTEEYILELEAKAIVAYNSIENGYNTIPGGNRIGISLGQETKEKISESLNRYYEVNESVNKGRDIETRVDDAPLCVFGFWFPNVRTAVRALNINRKTIYARKAEGTLHLEYKTLKEIVRPERGSEEDLTNRSSSMKGKNAGELNGMFGKKNPSRSRRVLVEGVVYDSITEAVKNTVYTKSQIEKRLYKMVEGFEYVQ